MPNWAFYDMTVYGSKESIDRLEKILECTDPEYYIYRVDNVDREDGPNYTNFKGNVAWGINHWFEDKDEMNESTGKTYTTLTKLSEVLHLTLEVLAEECGCCFMQYYTASEGKVIRSDETYWYDVGEVETLAAFKDAVEFADKYRIPYDKRQAEKVVENIDEYIKDHVCFEFGGFVWESCFNTEDDIKAGKAPTIRTSIFRE